MTWRSSQNFYERYPYPRPIDDLDNYRRRWQDPNRRRADFHLFWPDKPYTEERTILVAGCGNIAGGEARRALSRRPVVGIDFSATSVRHTEISGGNTTDESRGPSAADRSCRRSRE